ncbi:MAG: DUF6502 family protein [Gammaproteobacteria bacterium]
MLSGWHQDPEFLDSAGNPRELAVDGTPPGFAEFVRRYGGDSGRRSPQRNFNWCARSSRARTTRCAH